MVSSRRNTRPQVTRTSPPVEVSVFSITPGSGGQEVVAQAPSSSDAQKRYTEQLREADESLTRALKDFEDSQETQYNTLLSTILAIPLADIQNGSPTLSRPTKQKVAAGAVEIIMGHMDDKALDAAQEAFRLYWPAHFGSVVGEAPRPKPRKATPRQRRVVGHSSPRGGTQQPAAQKPPNQNPILSRLNFSASDAVNASDAPTSATESNFSSQSQTPTTLSDGDLPYYFPTGYHHSPSAPHIDPAVYDHQELFPQSAPGYPFPTLTSGNSGSVVYPGVTHGVDEMAPYPGPSTAGRLHYPHQAFHAEEVSQADNSHSSQDYFLPPTPQASSHLVPPQPRHQSTDWQPVAGTSRSGTYPHYQPGN